jgi:methyl-accepting chemotaxis protein
MFLATSFVRPVNDLIARVTGAHRQTDMTFAAESTDEIGDLARSFRELIGSVQKQTQMLEAATSENQLLLRTSCRRGWRSGPADRAKSPNASKTFRWCS